MDNAEVLQRFGDLPIPIEVELGTLTLPIGEIFGLSEGTVLTTDHPSGVPFTLRAGGAELASVEVVVIQDSLSVRVQSMAKPKPVTGTNGTN
ncbi:MAG TPA: FliM/FliN family flagellar motor switch protein [Bryobacteraceae bacterium]|nr:FliM/FliN family flagellar motor switch protein [Bryobacteraceae bacterium]